MNGFYMFRALLTHPQKALNKRHLVYSVRVMSVGCTLVQITDMYYCYYYDYYYYIILLRWVS
jgi:hypothetical protein